MKSRVLLTALFLAAATFLFPLCVEAAEKTIYNSPYVSFSPDGKAWTTNANDIGRGDGTDMWDEDYLKPVEIKKISSTALKEGEHYYKAKRTGQIPVGYWEVTWVKGQCIHDGYPPEGQAYHGISYGRQSCLTNHYSGWTAYCADCGESITSGLIYMSREAAKSIAYIRVEDDLDYYYLCPFCSNLEQGYTIQHYCKDISSNRYRVVYDANRTGADFGGGGFMSPSIHMYNNDTKYEGQTVTPVTRLTPNTYSRTGYRFAGWNTEPDGSGTFFEDGARILNLTTENWDGRGNSKAGTVVLYAQWEPAENTLRIDPAGGLYDGTSSWQRTMPYGSVYTPEASLLVPPAGYRVSFECGGGDAIALVRCTMHFTEWSMVQGFTGTFRNGKYTYNGADGTIDILKARYEGDSIVLPGPVRAGYSFGGWYYDAGFTRPAGGAGDSITPTADITLYAQWVELVLQSVDNYSVNGGKGAVDLSWSQPDGRGKTYLIYQSRNLQTWSRINTAEDIDSSRSVEKAFSYTGTAQSYTVPYSGIYTLAVSGAQGGGYGGYTGGAGGSVTGRFYLYQGELLTVAVGGQNGYNGGGAASLYGTGGGMTSLVSDKKGTLLIAGGGGGATALYNGYAGGSEAGVVSSGSTGLSGASGGGGGYQGGLSGELIYHEHSNTVCGYHKHTDDCYTSHGHSDSCYTNYHQHVRSDAMEYDSCGCRHQTHYYRCNYPGCGREWSSRTNYSGDCTQGHKLSDSGFNQHGEHSHVLTCRIPTTPTLWCPYPEGWQCGKTTSTIESAKPSYGGSSYVNTAYALSYSMTAGSRTGNGSASVRAELIGFQDAQGLSGVSAPDLAAPDAVAEETVEKTSLGNSQVLISWQEPGDNGTDYYHKAETYLQGSASRLCESNVTKNTLTSGIRGYYYTVDRNPDTAASASGSYTSERSVTVQMQDYVQYLHLAAVDVAGNVSSTIHIRLDEAAVRWNVYTGQLQIGNGENVYAAAEGKTYYVRCDGVTPFQLEHSAYLDGPATGGYQLNYTIYQSEIRGQEGSAAENIIFTPSAENPEADGETKADGLTCSVNGTTLLGQYPYSITRRSNQGRSMESEQMFLLSRDAQGRYLDISPRAGAGYEADGIEEIRYSDAVLDAGNGITVIGDGEGPVISGLEVLESRDVIDRVSESVIVSVTAWDELSGVADFYVKVKNQDNYSEQTFYPENGVLKLEITSDMPLFTGDFTVTGWAADNVGNVTEISYDVAEFALETRIERILEPHTPVFKRGESGILYITTYGYADRVEVEFPAELPELNRSFDYTDMQVYRQESRLQFMIPLYTPANLDYVVTVRAYKDGRQLEGSVGLSVTVEDGTVLSEFRTRLR